MVLLLNIIVPVIVFVVALIGYHYYRKSKNKSLTFIKTSVIIVTVFLTHSFVRPSYIPKGDVPKMSKVVIEEKEIEMQDNLSKPKERDINKTLTVREEVKTILKEEK